MDVVEEREVVAVLADDVGREVASVASGLEEQAAKHRRRKTTTRNRETMRGIREEKNLILLRLFSNHLCHKCVCSQLHRYILRHE